VKIIKDIVPAYQLQK